MTNRRGFTLVEMLTVLMIIALVSSFTLVMVANARARARDDQRIADLKRLQQSLETYRHQVDTMSSTDASIVYPYPPRFRRDNAIAGSGVYPNTAIDDKTQDEGAVQPNYKNFLAESPKDPIYQQNYVYYAPACIRPGQGTVGRPAIISPAMDSQFPPRFRQAKQIRVAPNPGYCPVGSGWLPYVVYALLERPIKGENRQAGLVNLIENSDRAVAFSSSQPLYALNESNDSGGYGQTIAGLSFCFPASVSCPNGYTAETVAGNNPAGGPGGNNGGPIAEPILDKAIEESGTGSLPGGGGPQPSPVRSDPAGSPTAEPITGGNLFDY